MTCAKTLITFIILLGYIYCIECYPSLSDPNLDYEIVSGIQKVVPKVSQTTTRRPPIIKTPPPSPSDSKTFAFNPISQTWTLIKKTDPQLDEKTLVWNQNNDKWLT